jgi:hypothetical protein
MIMAGASRRGSELNLRRGWKVKMGASLMAGLAFFLCAKASAGDEQILLAFLSICGTGSGEDGETGEITRNTDLGTLKTLVIDLSKLLSVDIPNGLGGGLGNLKSLSVMGQMPGADKHMRAALERILALMAAVPKLEHIHFQDMKIPDPELPKELETARQPTNLPFRTFMRGTTVVPRGSPRRVKQASFVKVTCSEENFLDLLSEMPNLEGVKLIESRIETSPFGEGELFLRKLKDLTMERVEKSSIENVIKYEWMEELERLAIRNVFLDDLKFFEVMVFKGLKSLDLVSVGITNIEELRGTSFPILKELNLQGNGELRLEENTWTNELSEVKSVSMELDAYKMGNADMGRLFLNLEKLFLVREGTVLAELKMCTNLKRELTIELKVENVRRGDLEGLQVPCKNMCQRMEVSVIDQTPMEREEYEHLVEMFKGCEGLKEIDVTFTREQNGLDDLGFISILGQKGKLRSLTSFDVRGVNASRMLERLTMGVLCTRAFDGIRGTWDKTNGIWKVEGLSKTVGTRSRRMSKKRVSNRKRKIDVGGSGINNQE